MRKMIRTHTTIVFWNISGSEFYVDLEYFRTGFNSSETLKICLILFIFNTHLNFLIIHVGFFNWTGYW